MTQPEFYPIPYENVPDHLCPGWTPILAGVGRLLDMFKLGVFSELNLRCSNTNHSALPWITATNKEGVRQWVEVASHVNFPDQEVIMLIHFHPHNDDVFEGWSGKISFEALHNWVVLQDPTDASTMITGYGTALEQCFLRIPTDQRRAHIKTN